MDSAQVHVQEVLLVLEDRAPGAVLSVLVLVLGLLLGHGLGVAAGAGCAPAGLLLLLGHGAAALGPGARFRVIEALGVALGPEGGLGHGRRDFQDHFRRFWCSTRFSKTRGDVAPFVESVVGFQMSKSLVPPFHVRLARVNVQCSGETNPVERLV